MILSYEDAFFYKLLMQVGFEKEVNEWINNIANANETLEMVKRYLVSKRVEIKRIQRETGITTVFVTHDQDEAMSISDMIVVMKEGLVQQIGDPQKVYDDPVNLFVAKFLGTPPINVFEGSISNGKLYIGDNAVLDTPDIPDRKVLVGIRPEGFIPDENGPLVCDLKGVEVMGRDISIVSSHSASLSQAVRSIINTDSKIELGSSKVSFSLRPTKVFIFDADTEERVRVAN
jgi:multiple sugar transport system ATP-binding protein